MRLKIPNTVKVIGAAFAILTAPLLWMWDYDRQAAKAQAEITETKTAVHANATAIRAIQSGEAAQVVTEASDRAAQKVADDLRPQLEAERKRVLQKLQAIDRKASVANSKAGVAIDKASTLYKRQRWHEKSTGR